MYLLCNGLNFPRPDVDESILTLIRCNKGTEIVSSLRATVMWCRLRFFSRRETVWLMVHSLIPLIHVSSKRSLGLRDGVRFGINICDISHLELRVYGDIFLDNIREPNPNPLMWNSRRGQTRSGRRWREEEQDRDFKPLSSSTWRLSITHSVKCRKKLRVNSERTDLVRRRRSERIWCAGEGTNGSVHSRFRPIGDALARTPISTKPSSSSDYSSFPSELPACPGMEVTLSGDSRKKLEENDNVRSERVLYDIVSKSISSAAVDYSSNGPWLGKKESKSQAFIRRG